MENNNDTNKTGFKLYASLRVIVGILVTVAALWLVATVLGYFGKSETVQVAQKHEEEQISVSTEHETATKDSHEKDSEKAHVAEHDTEEKHAEEDTAAEGDAPGHETPMAPAIEHTTSQKPETHETEPAPTTHPVETEAGHEAVPHGEVSAEPQKHRPKGVAFVEATIKPLEYELYERFWGWRPNDIMDFTDNVNNFQLGVLEVTRRTVVILTERLSRTGATAAFDHNLENAMNWFMIKSNRYWFPSPESKYKAGLNEIKVYKENLEKGEANFHTRTDNLIPLLSAYEDLLGSCEENLVKYTEADGNPVSFFKADDYFFYTKGVASAMSTMLEAVQEDFLVTVDTRRGEEVLHHAIESLHHTADVKPLVVTNSSLSGVLANHRANLAAPLSHARFYIGVLIKILST
ncbi:DUF2333 family protein [Thermodesulfobacteriota bacterium]